MKTNHQLEFSHLDKVLYPSSGFSKQDILDYYEKVSTYILPHLNDRPLMMQRFPDGIDSEGFYQKNASDYFPDWIPTKVVEKEDGEVKHVICNESDTLLYLVNQGSLAFHTWLSLTSSLKKPDKLIIDLDPAENEFSQVQDAAYAVKNELDAYDVISFPMTTGSKGLHIVIRLDANESFETIHDASKKLGAYMCKKYPKLFTMENYKKDRKGKLYFDIQRNAYAQTGIAPYSLRALKGAPVATPLTWKEVNDSDLQSNKYHLKNIFRRLGQQDDPWPEYNSTKYQVADLLNFSTD